MYLPPILHRKSTRRCILKLMRWRHAEKNCLSSLYDCAILFVMNALTASFSIFVGETVVMRVARWLARTQPRLYGLLAYPSSNWCIQNAQDIFPTSICTFTSASHCFAAQQLRLGKFEYILAAQEFRWTLSWVNVNGIWRQRCEDRLL